jgi:DNA end-binding protein Ku
MAPRATWKGYLKLSLVSCSVALFPATSTSERIRFNIINRKTGHRVHNQVVDAETGKPVPEEDRVKGHHEKGSKYVLLEDEELEQVALESTHTIDIEEFIPRDEVDEIFLDESYYLLPNDKASQEAFAVVREAMKKEDMVGLGRVVLYRRERLVMLQPRGKGMLVTSLRYRPEVREEKRYFTDIPATKIPSDMLNLAVHILHSKRGHFDPSKFKDRYENALAALIKAKKAGKPLPEPAEPPPSNVINLMEALRQSVQGKSGAKRANSRRASSARGPSTRKRGTARSRMKRAS